MSLAKAARSSGYVVDPQDGGTESDELRNKPAAVPVDLHGDTPLGLPKRSRPMKRASLAKEASQVVVRGRGHSLHMDEDTHRDLSTGKLTAQQAFMSGRISVQGDMKQALQSASKLHKRASYDFFSSRLRFASDPLSWSLMDLGRDLMLNLPGTEVDSSLAAKSLFATAQEGW